MWIHLFGCSTEHARLADWWSTQCKKTFKQRLEKVPSITVNETLVSLVSIDILDSLFEIGFFLAVGCFFNGSGRFVLYENL